MKNRVSWSKRMIIAIGLLVIILWGQNSTEPPTVRRAAAMPNAILITLSATEDATVAQGFPTRNFGAEATVVAGHDEFTQETLALLKFDLSSIPPGATINSAKLQLNRTAAALSLAMNIGVQRVQANWSEGTVTWNTRPAISATVIDSVTVPDTPPDLTIEWDVLSLVQGWRNNTFPNQGLALIHPTTANNYRVFASSEAATATTRPRLVIDYTLPTATPTPTPTPDPPGRFNGRFFHDQNRNGVYDSGEAGFAGLLISLVRDAILVRTATSDSNGLFQFTGLNAGLYHVYLDAAPLGFDIAPSSPYHDLDDGIAGFLPLRTGANVTWEIPFVPESPPPTPTPVTLNLQPANVEFVQVNTFPSNPLGAGKSTLVRVYVRALGAAGPIPNVGGRLTMGDATTNPTLWRNGIEAVNTITVDPGLSPAPPNAPLERSLNFLLPTEWTREGTRSFTVWVNDDHGPRVAECLSCRSDNQQVVVRTFERFRPLNMMLFRVADAAGNMPSDGEIARSLRVVRQLYPIDRVQVFDRGVFNTDFNWAAPPGTPGNCNGAWNELILRFRLMSFWEFDPADDMFWHGFVDDRVITPDTGCAYTDSRESASQVSPSGLDGGFSAVHELGHNQGWQHVACGIPSGDTDPAYPIAGGLLDWSGIDLPGLNFLNNTSTFDVMSFCTDSQWISQYQYQRAVGRFASLLAGQTGPIQTQALPTSPNPNPNGNYLFVTGTIQDGVMEQFAPSYRVSLPPGSSDGAGTGPFTLEVQDESGAVLFTRNFTLLGHNHSGHETSGAFFEVVPFASSARRIVIKHAGLTIATRVASANTPTVQLLSPNGGENWSASGAYQITWTASDADGDALSYTLHYSPDNGVTWQTIVTNIHDTTYSINAALLAGSEQALIRVVASDGLNTASDTTNATFTVAAKPPKAFILTPETNQTFRVGNLIELDGLATDMEDGPLGDMSLVWTSDQQGTIGNGAHISTSSLLPGPHQLSLTATDSDGQSVSTSVEIFVEAQISQLYLPVIIK